MIIETCLFLSLLVGSVSSAEPNGRTKNELDMIKLDKYLRDTTKSDDVLENLVIVRDLFDSKSKSSVFTSLIRDEQNFIKLLGKFGKLDKIYEGSAGCDLQSYRTLFETNLAAGGQVCTRRSQVPEGRVEFIIYSCATKHAYRCREIYIQRFSRLRGELDPLVLKRVESLTKSLMSERFKLEASQVDQLKLDLARDRTVEALGDGLSAKIVLKLLADLDAARIGQIAKERAHNMFYDLQDQFSETFGAACDNYVKFMAAVFKPSQFDEQILPVEALRAANQEEQEFSVGSLAYQICIALPRDSLVNNMVFALNPTTA